MIIDELLEHPAGREEATKPASERGFLLYDGVFTDKKSRSERKFEIQLALTQAQRNAAEDLINRMYSWRGYGSEHRLSDANNCFTFIAVVDGEVVGTLSLTVDMNTGFAADNTFEDVLNAVRAKPGIQICELTKFAFCPSVAPMHVLASLFHTIFIFGTQRFACTDLFIEVNPRHIRFYQILLGFSSAGKLRPNAAVGAPSQLMRLRVSDIGKYISAHAGLSETTARSLYPYFLTAAQELMICERMALLDRQWPFD
ncbi:acetyltransferase [Erythrobacter sp.]|uniref:N-acyl amino acid synthase FeeM domain-containing protein n=1 Tax=Erythrobacter sp. TaxID=1042 RepID=UPI0025D4B04C|nr:acetyltransferase [Erythrobacter sp.]